MFFLTILYELVLDSASCSDIPIMLRSVGDVASDLAMAIMLCVVDMDLLGATNRRLIELLSTDVFLSFSGLRTSLGMECLYACIMGRRMSSGSR